MQSSEKKVDLVALLEEIVEEKDFYGKFKQRLNKKERKAEKRRINQMIDQYNDIIGKNTMTYL